MSWKGEWCRSIISKLRKQPLAHLFSAEIDKHERNINDLVSSEKQGSLRKWRDALLSALDGKSSSGFKEAVGADLRAWVQRKCHNLPRCRAENWMFEFEATREMLQSLVDEYRKKEPKLQEIRVVEKPEEISVVEKPQESSVVEKTQTPTEPRPRQEVKKPSAAYEPVDKYKPPILGDPSAAPRPVEKKITLFGP